MAAKTKYRSVFISDVHLGSPHCQASKLLDFLSSIDCQYLYLVGDIIDIWYMQSKGINWPPSHNRIIQRLLKIAKTTEVIFIPGNHDENLRNFYNQNFGNISILKDPHHFTADGRELLITHGDQFDHIVLNHKWLAKIGSVAYQYLLWFNTAYNKLRKLFGLEYWSLSAYLKYKTKEVTKVVRKFKTTLVRHAFSKGCDGVICGHIHSPACEPEFGYYNCGDWVESLTALAETNEGKMVLLEYEKKNSKN